MKKNLLFLLLLLKIASARADNGYNLWLRYPPCSSAQLAASYKKLTGVIYTNSNSETLAAALAELKLGLSGMLQQSPRIQPSADNATLLLVNIHKPLPAHFTLPAALDQLGHEGYAIRILEKNKQPILVIAANNDIGLLYGTYHLLRLLQTNQSLVHLNILEKPLMPLRLLNHWDNLDRTIERGYAGFSIWNWHTLPTYIDQRYTDYARANASIGINGTVLNNVNANATILSHEYLQKVAALATTFRPYGIRVYLSARFSAPIELGGLSTADPLDSSVTDWWKKKAAEIYTLIPDFGGFLVKANSEGQPGPQNYHRTHAEGANAIADALAPYGGIVIWRAFVYSNEVPVDRHKQAYNEFKPLDGKFRNNVILQVKNGAIDFQPREPFHPLFGALKQTKVMAEFQITQEYLGQGTHLVFLAPLFKECLNADTYTNGPGTTVARLLDGTTTGTAPTGMAGVANIGTDLNWCGHPFAQANWYAFGRLAWNHELSADTIAAEWLRMTFTNNSNFLNIVKKMMLQSREILVHYMTPLGLHHLMATGHHYGPGPWVNDLPRADWNPVYYHQADSLGIGFDRTTSGSNALEQYAPPIRNAWEQTSSTPEKFLLWFHHLPWTFQVKNGNTLWEELCKQYDEGVAGTYWLQQQWAQVDTLIDAERYNQVRMLLNIQSEEANWWRDACLLYFQSRSGLPFPAGCKKPAENLNELERKKFPYAPGMGK